MASASDILLAGLPRRAQTAAMSLQLYLAFIAATVALIALPGPNVALIVATSLARGRRFGLATVVGTTAAMVPQLALVMLGMVGTLRVAGHLFDWVRWLGVAYLVYLGVQAWRAPAVDLTLVEPARRSARAIALRGLLVSLTNPKTLLFLGAFLPQFVTPGGHAVRDTMLLGTTFVLLAAGLDCGWALAADRLRPLLGKRGAVRNKVTGGCYLAAAAGLASAQAK